MEWSPWLCVNGRRCNVRFPDVPRTMKHPKCRMWSFHSNIKWFQGGIWAIVKACQGGLCCWFWLCFSKWPKDGGLAAYTRMQGVLTIQSDCSQSPVMACKSTIVTHRVHLEPSQLATCKHTLLDITSDENMLEADSTYGMCDVPAIFFDCESLCIGCGFSGPKEDARTRNSTQNPSSTRTSCDVRHTARGLNAHLCSQARDVKMGTQS